MDEIKRFESDLKANEELHTKYESAIKEIAAAGEVKSDGEAMVKAAAQLGYSFTVTDLDKASAEQQELSDAELSAVTGGKNEDEHGHATLCMTLWHCATVTMHTSTSSQDVYCWSSYLCICINK